MKDNDTTGEWKLPNLEKIYIGPSLLASDFAHLADEVARCAEAGVDYLHLDIMDGHFVRNLSMGPQIVAAVNRSTDLFLDVHLMVYNPLDYIESFVAAGADRITFHFEAAEDVEDLLSYIQRCNVQAGLAFCPETSESLMIKYLNQADLLLLMTVNPGFGGQAFMPEVLEKVRFARHYSTTLGQPRKDGSLYPIQVDGGINAETAKLAVAAGANHLVAGTYLFKEAGLLEGVAALRKLLPNQT